MPVLKVSSLVHWASYGSLGGAYPPACRAAIVTETYDDHHHGPDVVSLAVITPWAIEFRRDIRQGRGHRNATLDTTDQCHGLTYPGGSWHWPA
jgi:hypothetical protein